MNCEHGKPIPTDDRPYYCHDTRPCGECHYLEMSLHHCRTCGETSYWASEFQHRPDCRGRRGPCP